MAEQPKKGRLTLYEDLLSKETRDEMAAKDAATMAEAAAAAAAKNKKDKDASLLFKPSFLGKKPAPPKAKPKPNFSSMHRASSVSTACGARPPTESSPHNEPPSSTAQPKVAQQRGFSDWLGKDDEADCCYGRPKRERGGRKKGNKKHKAQPDQQQTWGWDDIYHPAMPVPVQDYKRSDVEYAINDEWTRRLYEAHRRERRRQGSDVRRASREEDSYRPRMGMGQRVAPTAGLAFAPPPDFDAPSAGRTGSSGPYSARSSPHRGNAYARDDDDEPRASFAPAAPAVLLNVEESADDAYARRLALSGMPAAPTPQAVPPLPPAKQMLPGLAPLSATPPTPVGLEPKAPSASDDQKARVAAQIAAMKAKLGKPASATPPAPAPALAAPPPSTDSPWTEQLNQDATAPPPQPEPAAPPGVISGAPTYNPEYLARKAQADAGQPGTGPHTSSDDLPEEISTRPRKSDVAKRLMEKMGWEKGQGLGASGEGITTAIYAKAEKRKKKGDAHGGGFATPANMGKIVGGKKAKLKAGSAEGTPQPDVEDDPTRVSQVVKLAGMLENLDVDHEIAENNLMQEIGEEMGSQYGQVERLYVWRKHAGGEDDVFVKFMDEIAAAKCAHGMDGTEFAENLVKARFWDGGKFERGEYA